jgi:hypothetical protein
MRLAKRFLFRALFVYVIVYCFPFPLDVIPVWGEILTQPYTDLWNEAVPWVGERVFGVAVRFRPLGSGDTTYNYVQLYCYLVLAVAFGALWTGLSFFWRDRGPSDARLHERLRLYVRFVLAAAMISYGAYKIIPSQMVPPWLGLLIQPIGNASPMGILWTFMGASTSYMVFTGAAEMLGGLLLTARRTTLLGALVAIGVMGNVVMMNFSYDVPVKLYSAHLLLMAVFLAAPDLKRLAGLFVLNRPVPPAEQRPLFAGAKSHRAALVLRTAFVLLVAGTALHQSYEGYRDFRHVPKTRAYGIWEVEALTIDGQPRPLLATDEAVWRRLVFEWPGVIGIQRVQEARPTFYQLKRVRGPYMFDLTTGDPNWKAGLSYKLVGKDVLTLESELEGRKIQGRFRRVDESGYRLVSRGFRWVNEWPYNR